MSESSPNFFSIKRAARDYFAGEISEWTIRSWIRVGKLQVVKAGARVLIPRESLEKFLRPRKVA